MDPFILESSDIVYKNPWISVREDHVLLDEKKKIFGVVTFPKGASVVALDAENNIYLNKQYRYGLNDISVELPGGAIDDGESIEDAARRELYEEQGIIADELIPLGSTCGLTSIAEHIEYLFLAKHCKRDHDVHMDEDEGIEQIVIPFEDAVAMALSGEIRLSLSVIGVLRAKAFLENK